DFPGGNGAGEIPRRYQSDHAESFTNRKSVNPVAFGRHHQAVESRAFTTKITKDVDGPADFALRFRKGLSFFASHVFAELIELLVEEIGSFEEDGAASGSRHGRPGGKRCSGGVGGGIDVVRRTFGMKTDEVTRGRVAILKCLTALDPLAVDVVRK